MTAMLKMQLPYAFPRDRLECPENPLITLTHSSGALVPKPMITMPMTNGEMPSAFATFAAPSTNRSLDHASAASPATIITSDSQNGISVYI